MAEYSEEQIRTIVREVARTASILFDGELVDEIVPALSWKYMRDFDPEDRFAVSDNYDVEHAPFIAAKKTLLRLQMLAPADLPLQCLLWRPVPTLENQWRVIVWNGGPSRWWKWAGKHVAPPAEMVAALASGELRDVETAEEVVTTLAPVRDSLKEVVGVIEVSASTAEPVIHW